MCLTPSQVHAPRIQRVTVDPVLPCPRTKRPDGRPDRQQTSPSFKLVIDPSRSRHPTPQSRQEGCPSAPRRSSRWGGRFNRATRGQIKAAVALPAPGVAGLADDVEARAVSLARTRRSRPHPGVADRSRCGDDGTGLPAHRRTWWSRVHSDEQLVVPRGERLGPPVVHRRASSACRLRRRGPARTQRVVQLLLFKFDEGGSPNAGTTSP